VSLQQLQQQATGQQFQAASATAPLLDRPALTFQDTGLSTTGQSNPLATSFDLFTAATGGQGTGGQLFTRGPAAVPTAGPPHFDGVPTVPAVTSFEQFRYMSLTYST
jgi:hypothetical protein